MSSCLKPQGQEYMMEEGGAHSASSGVRAKARAHWPTLAWLGFTFVIALIALILGCWSTWSVSTKGDSAEVAQPPAPVTWSANLVSDPRKVPDGFEVVGHLYNNTGHWSLIQELDNMDVGSNMDLQPLSNHGVASYNGQLFVFGGLMVNTSTGTTDVTDVVTAYDVDTNIEFDMMPMPTPLYRFGWAVVGNKLYVFGGMSTTVDGNAAARESATYEYDLEGDLWRALPGVALATPRSGQIGAAIGTKIYAVGGRGDGGVLLGSVEVMDTAEDNPQWRETTWLPEPRADLRAVSLGSTLYAIGGTTDDVTMTKAMLALTPDATSWTPKADMMRARGDFALVSPPGSGRIMVIGGESGQRPEQSQVVHVAMPWVEAYVAEHDLWIGKAPLPAPRFRFGCSFVNDMIWVYGGNPTCMDNCDTDATDTIYTFTDNFQEANVYVTRQK